MFLAFAVEESRSRGIGVSVSGTLVAIRTRGSYAGLRCVSLKIIGALISVSHRNLRSVFIRSVGRINFTLPPLRSKFSYPILRGGCAGLVLGRDHLGLKGRNEFQNTPSTAVADSVARMKCK